MSAESNASPSTPGILLGRLVLSMVTTEFGSHVEIDESEATGLTPLEILGLLEMAKIRVYEDVIEQQYMGPDEDDPGQDGPDG